MFIFLVSITPVNTTPIVYQYLFLFAVVLFSAIIIFFINNATKIFLFKEKHSTFLSSHIYSPANLDDRFTIRTEGCIMTSLKPFDESIKQFVEFPRALKKCPNMNLALLKRNKTNIWIDKQNIAYYNISNTTLLSCCYRSFYRPANIEDISSTNVDNRVKYEDCDIFSDATELKDEFVRVTCQYKNKQVYDQYFLSATKKEFKFQGDTGEFSKNKFGYNIIILGIDAVSRLNFHRTMPKTYEYLRKKRAIELLGYNKVGDNTFPNLIALLLGIKETEIKQTCLPFSRSTFDNCPFIWGLFKEAGFYTAMAEDSASLGTFNYLRSGFAKAPTDYYPHTFIKEAQDNVGTNKDFNSKLCMNNKYFFNVLLDYVKELTFSLSTSKLFGFFWEITMSHDYLNYPMVMDKSYENLLKELEKSNYLNRTILFLVSDHGIRWGDIRSTKQGRLEERLPLVLILLPDSFRESFSKAYNNIKQNNRRLTSPFDLHATLLDLVNLNNIENDVIKSRMKEFYSKQRSISLFLPIPTNRTCETADIDDHWCTCRRSIKLSKKSTEGYESTNHLLAHLNKLVSNYPQCAQLTIEKLIDITEMLVGSPDENEAGWREFMVVVQTSPGRGIFEATLKNKGEEWLLSGTVSRLNLYGEQSRCVDNYQLKLYCYCQHFV